MIFQQDDDSREEGGVKKVEECLSVMPQTMTGDRRHSQVSLFVTFTLKGATTLIYMKDLINHEF